MSHESFWLDRYLPAKLHLVELLVPTGCLRWMLSVFSREDRRSRLQEVKRQVFKRDHLHCEAETLAVPNLTIDIVEAAWRVKANFVILLPALQDSLGKAGLKDLKTRLGEMGRCMLVLLRNGYVVRLEPCKTDVGREIRPDFG